MARRVPRRRLYDHEAARDAVEILVELIRFLLDPRRHTQATGSRNPARGYSVSIMIFSLPVQRTGPEKGVKIMSDCSRSKRLQCGPRQQYRAAIRHDLLGACPYLNKIVEQDNPSDQKPAPMEPRVSFI
jgi:hypothetical protein